MRHGNILFNCAMLLLLGLAGMCWLRSYTHDDLVTRYHGVEKPLGTYVRWWGVHSSGGGVSFQWEDDGPYHSGTPWEIDEYYSKQPSWHTSDYNPNSGPPFSRALTTTLLFAGGFQIGAFEIPNNHGRDGIWITLPYYFLTALPAAAVLVSVVRRYRRYRKECVRGFAVMPRSRHQRECQDPAEAEKD